MQVNNDSQEVGEARAHLAENGLYVAAVSFSTLLCALGSHYNIVGVTERLEIRTDLSVVRHTLLTEYEPFAPSTAARSLCHVYVCRRKPLRPWAGHCTAPWLITYFFTILRVSSMLGVRRAAASTWFAKYLSVSLVCTSGAEYK